MHSNNESESGLRFGETYLQIHYTLTDLKSFDLPSESETRFSVNPNPDSIIEYAPNINTVLRVVSVRTIEL